MKIAELPHKELLEKVASLNPGQGALYLVGGSLRDLKLGRKTKDLDICGGFDMRELARRVARELQADWFALDEARGTYRVLARDGAWMMDFNPFRAADLMGDLAARDLRINAMAVDLADPYRLIDPLDGCGDIEKKRLRACSARSMADDPLRVLRAIRFATDLEFEIDGETGAWMREAAPGLVIVAAERVREEFFLLLERGNAEWGLQLLSAYGGLVLFPELAALQTELVEGVEGISRWDYALRTLHYLEQISGSRKDQAHDPAVGLVLGKLRPFAQQIHEHLAEKWVAPRSAYSALAFSALYTRRRDSAAKGQLLQIPLALQRAEQLAVGGTMLRRIDQILNNQDRVTRLASGGSGLSNRAIYRFFRASGEAGVEICLLTLARRLALLEGRGGEELLEQELEVCIRLMEAYWEPGSPRVNPPPLVNGEQIMAAMSIKPGALVGKMIRILHEEQACGNIHSVEEALDLARLIQSGVYEGGQDDENG